MKKCLLLVILSFLLVGCKHHDEPANSGSVHFDFFKVMSPSADLATYMCATPWLTNSEITPDFVNVLNDDGYFLMSDDADSVRVGSHYAHLPGKEGLHSYVGPHNLFWLDYINPPSKTAADSSWRKVSGAIGWYSGTDTGRGQVYFPVDSIHNASLNATFASGKSIINVGFELPFVLHHDIFSMGPNEQKIYKATEIKLEHVLKVLIHHLTSADDQIYAALNEPLSAQDRIFGFTQFWTEVKYNFAFFNQVPELDWNHVLYQTLPKLQSRQSNDEYYRTLEEVCALLHDGHTDITPPAYIENQLDYPAVTLSPIEGNPIVINVSVPLEKDLPIGSKIIEVDGTDVNSLLKERVFPYISASTEYIAVDKGIRDLLEGPEGSKVDITVMRPDGSKEMVPLIRNRSTLNVHWVNPTPERGLLDFRKLSNGLAYVALNRFNNPHIDDLFNSYADSILSCKALIIDLRYNGGGNSGVGYNIVGHFTDKPFQTSSWKSPTHTAAYKAWGSFIAGRPDSTLSPSDLEHKEDFLGNRWYYEPAGTWGPSKGSVIRMPIVLLIGHETASAAEDFVVAMDQLGIAKKIGSNTFGSTGQPLTIRLPGGGSARICTKRDTYANGKEFVGYGIAPDFRVEETVDDLIHHRDPVLAYAINYLEKGSTTDGSHPTR